jgi:glucose-1-phosphate cytidylyltransferase
MKAIILAGGHGTRISEETSDKPKPMVLVGDKPILWHVMSIFALQGVTEFVIALGYKGDKITDWFKTLGSGLIEISPGHFEIYVSSDFPSSNRIWRIHLVDTGLNTQTGGRIKRILSIFSDESYFVTYGDGLGNVRINDLYDFHKKMGLAATVTAVHPPARFGHLTLSNGVVDYFGEKRVEDLGWINGGFFVLDSKCSNVVNSDSEPFEQAPMTRLTRSRQLAAFEHNGFWHPMDTLRDKVYLNELIQTGIAPWLMIND